MTVGPKTVNSFSMNFGVWWGVNTMYTIVVQDEATSADWSVFLTAPTSTVGTIQGSLPVVPFTPTTRTIASSITPPSTMPPSPPFTGSHSSQTNVPSAPLPPNSSPESGCRSAITCLSETDWDDPRPPPPSPAPSSQETSSASSSITPGASTDILPPKVSLSTQWIEPSGPASMSALSIPSSAASPVTLPVSTSWVILTIPGTTHTSLKAMPGTTETVLSTVPAVQTATTTIISYLPSPRPISESSRSSSTLSTGSQVGIDVAVGLLAFATLAAVGVYMYLYQLRRERRQRLPGSTVGDQEDEGVVDDELSSVLKLKTREAGYAGPTSFEIHRRPQIVAELPGDDRFPTAAAAAAAL